MLKSGVAIHGAHCPRATPSGEYAASTYNPTGASVTVAAHDPFENTTVSTFATPY
jgi:hypothetical protein